MPFVIRLALTFLLLSVFQFYFIKKTKSSLSSIFIDKNPKSVKWIMLILLNTYPLGILIYYLVITFIFQQSFIPPQNSIVDYLLIYPFWISFLIVVQSILFLLTFDTIRIPLSFIWKSKKDKINSVFRKLSLAVISFFIIYVPIRVFYDLNTVEIREVNYYLDSSSDQSFDYKIALISDVQADRYTTDKRLDNFFEKVNSTNPDLVLIAGDIITNTPFYINFAAEKLGSIRSKDGVFSCVGDHDNWAYRGDTERSRKEISDALAKEQIQFVDNEVRRFSVNGNSIGVAFLTDTYSERIEDQKLNALLDSLENDDVKIVLTHQPGKRIIENASKRNFDLMFAGHTHGGQITFLYPFFNPSVTHFETNLVRGDFWFDKMLLIVTPGLGMSLAPVRYNSTPEVTIINFTNK